MLRFKKRERIAHPLLDFDTIWNEDNMVYKEYYLRLNVCKKINNPVVK